jgi:hypothetical protein
MQSILINKCFLFVVGSVCRVKRFHIGGRHFADDEEFETEVREWLRQRSIRLLCCRFRRTGKAMGRVCQHWWRICFFQVRISHVLRLISICDLFIDCPSYHPGMVRQVN